MRCGIFPGQGNQFTGMGLELYNSSSAARAIYDSADKITRLPIKKVSFHGTPEQQKDPVMAQLIAYTNSCAILETQESPFDMYIGHSVGEYAALYAAQAMTFEDGLEALATRGSLMKIENARLLENQNHKSPFMVAMIGAELSAIEEICKKSEGRLQVALYNCPGNYVVAGLPDDIHSFGPQIAGIARKLIALEVSGPIHTSLYNDLSVAFFDYLEGVDFLGPAAPVYANAAAKMYTGAQSVIEGLASQVCNPVKWEQTIIDILAANPDSEFVEMGPGNSLTGMVRRIKQSMN